MITNKQSLKQAIAGFLLRDDLTEQIDAFIQLGEAQINRDLRHPRMEMRQEIVLDDSVDLLDAWRWLEVVSISFQGENVGLSYLTPFGAAEQETEEAGQAFGDPKGYRVEGDTLRIVPEGTGGGRPGTMVYVAAIPPLVDADDTNWLLREYPDTYLYASLMHSAPFLMEDNRLAMWGDLYAAAVGKVNRVGKQSRLAGARLRVRNRGIGFGHQVR